MSLLTCEVKRKEVKMKPIVVEKGRRFQMGICRMTREGGCRCHNVQSIGLEGFFPKQGRSPNFRFIVSYLIGCSADSWEAPGPVGLGQQTPYDACKRMREDAREERRNMSLLICEVKRREVGETNWTEFRD